MTELDNRQQILDEEHLRLLSLGYWISAGSSAFFSLIGLFYMGLGLFFETAARHFPSDSQSPPPRAFGLIFGMIGLVVFLLLIGCGILQAYAAVSMKKRNGRILCMIAAAVTCLSIPFGTALGILTFMVLTRPSVVQLFSKPVVRQ